jgi:hypothetical protein
MPAQYYDLEMKLVSFQLEKKHWLTFKKLSKSRQQSMSALFRKAILNYYKEELENE